MSSLLRARPPHQSLTLAAWPSGPIWAAVHENAPSSWYFAWPGEEERNDQWSQLARALAQLSPLSVPPLPRIHQRVHALFDTCFPSLPGGLEVVATDKRIR